MNQAPTVGFEQDVSSRNHAPFHVPRECQEPARRQLRAGALQGPGPPVDAWRLLTGQIRL